MTRYTLANNFFKAVEGYIPIPESFPMLIEVESNQVVRINGTTLPLIGNDLWKLLNATYELPDCIKFEITCESYEDVLKVAYIAHLKQRDK